MRHRGAASRARRAAMYLARHGWGASVSDVIDAARHLADGDEAKARMILAAAAGRAVRFAAADATLRLIGAGGARAAVLRAGIEWPKLTDLLTETAVWLTALEVAEGAARRAVEVLMVQRLRRRKRRAWCVVAGRP